MRLRRWLLAVGLIFVGCAGVRAQRLPGGVRPQHYALTITPDLAKARFAGSERIDVVLDKPAKTITLNAAEIEFVSVRATVGGDASKSQVATVVPDPTNEQATFLFDHPLDAGPVTLEIAYTGILNDKLRGFYLSKTKLRNYGVTQFEATDARRAFPCFDEPALKATFDVSLIVDTGDTAISNMKMVSDKPGPVAGKHTVAFATTPKMSTYLVAWLVGDFQCSEGKSEGVKIRACATPDKAKLTEFAVQAAKWDLKYYDRYFGIKYPLAKLDLVAIPDFESGAMENFGCITFRETELLVDAKEGALAAKKEVATTVAHEMSHQWFGDLVTPAWWDNLWLNEGFATWMESKASAVWQPKWGFDQDVATDLNHTLDEDAGRITRPIRQPAETPAEINALFDDIAYGKAGAVIGMVENWVGEETFRKGVQAYLSAHLYGNATGEDFWNTQTRVSGLPVDKVMQSFIDKLGVPEVVVVKHADGGEGLDQMPFQHGSAPPGNESTTLTFIAKGDGWTIPVCIKTMGTQDCRLIVPQGAPIALIDPAAPSPKPETPRPPLNFFYANAGDKGYYRTAYTPDEWKAIEANAESKLTPAERIGLLGDEWALMRAGEPAGHPRTVGDFLDLALAVKQDPSATVLDGALGKVDAIEARIATDEDRERLDAVVRREFGPVYAALGGPQKHETDDHADLRETLFEELGDAKDPAVLAEAESMTKQLFSGQRVADPALADAAVALATVKGDTEMYEKLLRVSKNTSDPDVKEAALRALTRFEAPELVMRTLLYAVSDEVRNQDTWMLITPLLARRTTQDLAWEFVQQHWAAIEHKATESSDLRIVEAAGSFCTAERRDEVASFFREHAVDGTELTLEKSIDSINDCIHLRAAQEPELRAWLNAHAGQ